MSTAAERAKQRALQFAPPGTTGPEVPADPAPPAAPRVRQRPIRRTVDLPPTRHHKLQEWQGEQASLLGVARVASQDVLEELAKLLLTDETTARKVAGALRKRYDEA